MKSATSVTVGSIGMMHVMPFDANNNRRSLLVQNAMGGEVTSVNQSFNRQNDITHFDTQ